MVYESKSSRAAAYAVLSVHTAYLLAHYPIEYYTAYLNSIITKQDKVRYYMALIKKEGIEISRPDINKCSYQFTCEEDKIYMGLNSLKFVGEGIKAAIENREKEGSFKDLQDLLTRVSLSKREVESLIKAGSFDSFNIATRSQMLNKFQDIMNLTKSNRKKKEQGQFSLFDICEDPTIKDANIIKFPKMEEFNKMKIFAMEKEVSGFYLSGHPLDLPEYKDFIEKSTITTTDDFSNEDNKRKVKLVGIVSINDKQGEGLRISKSGNYYANFTLEDRYGTIKVLGFKDVIEDCKKFMFNENIVEITGTLSVDIEQYEDENGEIKENRDIKIFLDTIKKITSANDRKKVYIQLDTKNTKNMIILKEVAKRHQGCDNMILYDPNLKQSYKYNETINFSELLIEDLKVSLNISEKDIVAKKIS